VGAFSIEVNGSEFGKSQLLTILLHHKDDVIQKSMRYFTALLWEGDKNILRSYFAGGSQTAPKV